MRGDPLFGVKAGYHRMRRRLDWLRHPQGWATERAEPTAFQHLLASRASPLERSPAGAAMAYTAEKTRNLGIAAAAVSGCVIGPGRVFSFCRTVGPATRSRGYVPALELRGDLLVCARGGGLCQLSNLLLLLAVDVDAEIVERHRHTLDLFPDAERSAPFGCGATVFYNYIDFQFRNTLSFPIILQAEVAPPDLRASIRGPSPLPYVTRLVETDHRFVRLGGVVYRENRVWRERVLPGGCCQRELLFENRCRVLYPADHLVGNEQDE